MQLNILSLGSVFDDKNKKGVGTTKDKYNHNPKVIQFDYLNDSSDKLSSASGASNLQLQK
jgi:hypothetical protein